MFAIGVKRGKFSAVVFFGGREGDVLLRFMFVCGCDFFYFFLECCIAHKQIWIYTEGHLLIIKMQMSAIYIYIYIYTFVEKLFSC